MNREDFIKFIPKPSNKDIILYDISLKDLIDVDVLQEYNKTYPVFANKKEKYAKMKEKIDEYETLVKSIYLFKPSWTEADYLQSLQNDKRTYSTLYNEVKKTENNIQMLQKKLNGINEKISIQAAKDNKNIDDKKIQIDKNIDKNKETLTYLKDILDSYKSTLKDVEELIQENNEQFEALSKMEEKAKAGKCKCEFCGRTIKTTTENSVFFNKMIQNFEKNKERLAILLERKEKIKTSISYYESEIQKTKDTLNNDMQFKKENTNFYHKKSIEVLKLEALRDETLNAINKLTKELESNPTTKSKKYLELKSNIQKYELSLDNLNKVKEIKEQSKYDVQEFNSLRNDIKEMLNKISQYIKFLKIYYKILEQKASEFCGPDFKFKFYKIEEYQIIPILEITYKGVEYSQLGYKAMQEIDKILAEKFSIYS